MNELNYESIIERIINCHYEQLNAWEQGFMDNIFDNVFSKKNTLTQKQREKILDINSKILGRKK